MHDGRVNVFVAMGGNFLSATPDTEFTAEALRKCALTAHVATKLNRAHLVTGRTALILPCLGRSERDSIESLERVTRRIIEMEERAREQWVRDARLQLEDKVWRGYGALRFCRAISSREVIELSSVVRMGVALGFPGLPPLSVLNELLILTQPAHLQRLYGADMTPPERNVYRARLVRERLEAAGHEAGDQA